MITSYSAVKTLMFNMIKDLQFEQHADLKLTRFLDDKPDNTARSRQVWFEDAGTKDGAIAKGVGESHVIHDIVLRIHYASNLRKLSDTAGDDAATIRQRLTDTKYQGWPASAVMNITSTSYSKNIGTVITVSALRFKVHYISRG